MKQKLFRVTLLIGMVFIANTTMSQPFSLFIELGDDLAYGMREAHEISLSDDVNRWRLVVLNPDVVDGFLLSEGDALDLTLFDREYTATVDRVSTNVMGTVSIRARINGYTYGYLIISTYGQDSHGVIRIPENRENYRIQTIEDPLYSVLMEIDPDKVEELELHGPLIPPPPKEDSPEIMRMEQLQQEPLGDPMGPARIDVMVVYTEAALNGAGGVTAMNNLIAQGMETGQLTLDNSGTLISINLVHSGLVEYEESGSSSDDLRRLTASPSYNPWGSSYAGYMDIVHEWRDQHGADLVALLTETGSSGGTAWLLNKRTGRPDMGFSLTRRVAAGGMTFIHELGHNMGAQHHKEQNYQPGPTSWSDWSENQWSAGWRWVGNDSRRYCSVMTYPSGSYFPDGMTHARVEYFSNPGINYQGVATGHAVDGDNARTLREIRHVVAAYRADMHPDVVQTPIVDPEGRTHFGPLIDVLVSCATDGAVIRYTMGSGTVPGEDPDETTVDTIASGETVNVPVPGWLKVKAWKEGMHPSDKALAVYTLFEETTEWVEIGDPGNEPDDGGAGSVDYIYWIGAHAVSISQWMDAYAADPSISNGNEDYWASLVGSDAPATRISGHEAARFCNWLTSGNISNGVYQLDESLLVTGVGRTAALEQYGTAYAIPTRDEWHKAAYWTGSGYSDYANGTDTPPFAGVEANYNPLGIPWAVGSGTVEQNGTFDMMGNVIEWTETPHDGDYTGRFRAHGGNHSSAPSALRKSSISLFTPTSSSTSYGLRVAALHTPSTGTITHDEATINMDFVTIEDSGNNPDSNGKGSIGYAYQIGKHEVTIGQFMTARSADPAISNGSEDYWNKGSFSLGTNAPATTVTWYEAAKFCNWLTSGSASNGVYQLDTGGVVTNVNREAAALIYDTVYVIPTEDEWYKAAYWTGTGYSLYATGTDTPPVAHLDANYSPTDSPWEVTAGAEEQNRTFNMMGNVQEWSESVTSNQGQYLLGGNYSQNAQRFRAGTTSSTTNKMMESIAMGLRLVQLKLDADANGLPDWWEIEHFGSTGRADPDEICANARHTVRQAYIGGFDPNAPDGGFRLSGLKNTGNEKILNWNAVSGRVYSVYWTTNLLSGFQCLESNIPWTRGSFTNQSDEPCGYYKIEVKLAP